ncbi:RNA polymerase sigma factor [Desulforhopalus sp. IMCC35007]|uniref:RNA polymerase sigma factor n=1 Tax=Desulforhopalus sp. IMCC35007 TaxID=2569543 RepID=UPI0010ADB135|nr:RNA polymerase sigma factor [Desulforhopalus sp. IMCC35007]TKB05684.1 RNA polymerase sigma factor [Desulforhopalus sp. IMCC35007]
MDLNLKQHVRQAKDGDLQALEKVVSGIQERIYGLALRMLGHQQDAEDEAQEILIKIITHLSDFREESAFTSWVYRIACNHILTARKKRTERLGLTFDILEDSVSAGLENIEQLTVSGPERDVLLEETRVGCMQGALVCLEREVRIVMILGEQYGVTSKEGAFILDITPELFRKRLSRGKKSLQDFMMKNCGLVNSNNPCRCHKQAGGRLKNGLIDMKFVKKEKASQGRTEAVTHLRELDEIDRSIAMYRRYPEYHTPESFTHIMKNLISTGKYNVLGG